MKGKYSENKEIGWLFIPPKRLEVENGKKMCVTNFDSAYLAEFLKKFSLSYLKNITKLFIITFKSCCTNFADERRILSNKNECEIHSKVIMSQDYFDY